MGNALRQWRQARGLSQLELATIVGSTQRHLSFVENGRSQPGRELLIRLSEALELSLRERNALLESAGFLSPYTELDLDAPELRAVRDTLARIVEAHMPFPAFVIAPYGRVVFRNAATDVFFEGADPALLRPPVNVLRVMLHPAGMAPRLRNLETWGRHVVENLRARARKHPDPELDEFVAELASYLPARDAPTAHLGFSVPMQLRTADGELRLITALTSFATATDVTLAELRLETFLPADQATADHLRTRATI